TRGPEGGAPAQWPSGSRARRAAGQATLVMLGHPQCPCTRATIAELALLMTHCQGRVQATVLFLKPAGVDEQWVHTDLWDSAARIPGVHVMEDSGGVEAERFGALTSGQTLLYDANGRLLFSGGITDGRGHEGENPGRDAVEALLRGEPAGRAKNFVFGCGLRDARREAKWSR
ncbi:MAG TPA: hypothetical protein VEU62_11975, partial [Bryobacterales bacterium]|nr:hypothetical protein [Bryobacterales bacterium]